MSDGVLVRVTFKNALLVRLIRERGLSFKAFAEAVGIGYQVILQMIGLKYSPYAAPRFHKIDNPDTEFRQSALRVAEYFDLPPGELFPEDIYRVTWPDGIEREIPARRIACLISDNARERALPPHELFEINEDRDRLRAVLSTLTPREQRVLTMRFGIDGEGAHTLDEIAEDFELGRERIRQIEARAIRKLRHPSRLGNPRRLPFDRE